MCYHVLGKCEEKIPGSRPGFINRLASCTGSLHHIVIEIECGEVSEAAPVSVARKAVVVFRRVLLHRLNSMFDFLSEVKEGKYFLLDKHL